MSNIKEVDEDEDEVKANPKGKGKRQLIIIIIAILSVFASGGGVWYYMQAQLKEALGETAEPKPIPTTFVELDIFTINLMPEESNQYLQVGLTVKTTESDEVIKEIGKQMPAIRNKILILLSSKTAAEISSVDGKKQLSTQIVDEIKQSIDSEEMQEQILEVLFTAFVIQ